MDHGGKNGRIHPGGTAGYPSIGPGRRGRNKFKTDQEGGTRMGIINHFYKLAEWVQPLSGRKQPMRGSTLGPGLTALRLREVLDEKSFATRSIPGENLLSGTLHADEDFNYDVHVFMEIRKDLISICCIAEDFVIPGIRLMDALLFCNKWNNERIFPSVSVDSFRNTLVTHYNVLLDKTNTTDFLREQVAERGLGISWSLFVEAGKRFPELMPATEHEIVI